MSDNDLPNILIVDDNDGVLSQQLEQGKLASSKTLHPEEIDKDDVLKANLVLVDYQLDNWPARDNGGAPISRKPSDGLALASVLRRHVQEKESPPTAFAILTGQMGALASPLPLENRNHVLAKINNMEWVFRKSGKGSDVSLADQVVDLANAAKKLPSRWFPDLDGHSMKQLLCLLGVQQDEDDADMLSEDISRCNPPLHELSQWSHGLTILRWLLHYILPYPCFLFDTHYLASRLRVEYEAFSKALDSPDSPLKEALKGCEYNGILSRFAGPRWWRSKIELLLWDRTEGNAFNLAVLRTLVKTFAQQELLGTASNHPIVCLDENYRSMNKSFTMEATVRIRPDDWPAYADQAWTTIELALKEPSLKSLVLAEDREKLA